MPGQQVLREIKQLMLAPEFVGRVVFLEDYDMQLSRWLVSGVDVWLNNLDRALEASGTSGMKAAVNGVLNLQRARWLVGRRWTQDNGWGIPPINVQDPERRDALEAELDLRHARRGDAFLSITRATPRAIRRSRRVQGVAATATIYPANMAARSSTTAGVLAVALACKATG